MEHNTQDRIRKSNIKCITFSLLCRMTIPIIHTSINKWKTIEYTMFWVDSFLFINTISFQFDSFPNFFKSIQQSKSSQGYQYWWSFWRTIRDWSRKKSLCVGRNCSNINLTVFAIETWLVCKANCLDRKAHFILAIVIIFLLSFVPFLNSQCG